MAAARKRIVVACVCAALLMTLAVSSPSCIPVKGVYFPEWSNVDPSSVETKLYTHIFYAFVTPHSDTFQFQIDQTRAPLLLNFTSTIHAANPPLITLFSVGGAAEGTAFFSRLASNSSSRAAFIHSSIQVARKFGFDGVDLDWEFPETPTDMENLGYLLDEWRAEVQKEAAATGRPPLLLTAAVYYSADTFLDGMARAYPAASVSRNLDLINVMNYDYHGAWNKSVTGAQAALFDPSSNLSTSYGLGSWVRAGVPRSKLVMGLPLYGRTWKLRDRGVHGVGMAAVDVGPGWNGTGVLTYAEVVEFNKANKAKVVYDVATVSVYSVAGDYWVGYDDKKTVAAKIGYAKALGLRGYFFWAINGDYKSTISKTASKLWRL
ncbi:nod factor hydrolase protein 1-like [Salvia hispanica]|uniref:nod factor hydrolase protein 1-like n=1 Tax=Salvia hispanica TaxID=49212 RepID=UPI002009D220|nr:nod factor hydrolase protein 1-like [Salvia hispanica]